jgi:hypothetical protein
VTLVPIVQVLATNHPPGAEPLVSSFGRNRSRPQSPCPPSGTCRGSVVRAPSRSSRCKGSSRRSAGADPPGASSTSTSGRRRIERRLASTDTAKLSEHRFITPWLRRRGSKRPRRRSDTRSVSVDDVHHSLVLVREHMAVEDERSGVDAREVDLDPRETRCEPRSDLRKGLHDGRGWQCDRVENARRSSRASFTKGASNICLKRPVCNRTGGRGSNGKLRTRGFAAPDRNR